MWGTKWRPTSWSHTPMCSLFHVSCPWMELESASFKVCTAVLGFFRFGARAVKLVAPPLGHRLGMNPFPPTAVHGEFADMCPSRVFRPLQP